REALEDALLRYTNKAITTAEMITRLIELAKHLREAQRHGEDLGLSEEETAFYDALAENGSAKEVMKSDTLRLMARELAEMVKKMPKLDWTQRESVRADLRRKVRRLLAMYGYPPDLSEPNLRTSRPIRSFSVRFSSILTHHRGLLVQTPCSGDLPSCFG